VTEGTYTNVAIVTDRGEVVTPSLESAPMLNGITRQILVHAAPQIVQRAVHAHELATAREILLIGTTTMVTTVTPLDGRPMNAGAPSPGPIAGELLRTLVQAIERGEDDIAD
jgi:branched-subunit amino acid aminotransferase/4-amino-4-deoxychorismate lyase